MSRAGSGRGKGTTTLTLVCIAFLLSGIGMAAFGLLSSSLSRKPAAPVAVAPMVPTQSAPQAVPSSEPAPPVFVPLFDPAAFVLEEHGSALISTGLGPVGNQTTGVLNPTDPQLPNMLLDPGRTTKPGTEQGTVLFVAHSRLNDEGNKFNKLMSLPGSVDRGDYRVVLSNGADRMSYDVEAVLDVEKVRFGDETYKYLQDNRPGRVLLITSWVRGTYPPPEKARIVIGCDAAHPGCSAP